MGQFSVEIPPQTGSVLNETQHYAFEGDYQPVWDPLLVSIDMGEITLS